ncbi:molybdenum ABC transporter ATP-binding protein [Nitzschia inconspicua]|uniref:Molybdenum ABC transporter ATP-binding protein n=1 Tax=Nitzschia inconspicua TaxID=303405 RepID=A0A9K3M604_9STRA|nr:molybdenum ABC transporter ATP-binding protein [Nitzschia inconspicua]
MMRSAPAQRIVDTSNRVLSQSFLCLKFSTSAAASISEDNETSISSTQFPSTPPLLQFSKARLSYISTNDNPYSRFATEPFSWSIHPPNLTHDNPLDRQGGYALLGRNGTAKSLLGLSLMATTQTVNLRERLDEQQQQQQQRRNTQNPYLIEGDLSIPSGSRWHSRAVAHVSFHSHQELLEERDEKTGEHLTAFKAIATAGGAPGKLNPAAQFLVVRFGLYPLLHRTVNTLSTGEIRKVLLIRALSQRPKLLVLDNAFDGLDVPSRNILKDLVSRTLRGFTQDILVQGVSSKATARTQIVLMTHRAEEIVDEIDTVAWFERPMKTEQVPNLQFQMLKRHHHDGREPISPVDSLYQALGMNVSTDFSTDQRFGFLNWQDPTLPDADVIKCWWNQDHLMDRNTADNVVVKADGLTIRRGDATLLYNLDWTVRQGERWIVGGGNGAGKSTLSRLLANPEFLKDDVFNDSSLQIMPKSSKNNRRSNAVGWVSTETHLNHHQGPQKNSLMTTRDFFEAETAGSSFEHVILPVIAWLEIASTATEQEDFLSQPFHHLSQGQQKMALLAAAIAKRPPLLVLDEPCQGLDLMARQRLLQVVERICVATDMSLIYITHHLEEEKIPSISHALHLKDRRAVFQGPIDDYSPDDFYASSSES